MADDTLYPVAKGVSDDPLTRTNHRTVVAGEGEVIVVGPGSPLMSSGRSFPLGGRFGCD
jgi:hypothetical protein